MKEIKTYLVMVFCLALGSSCGGGGSTIGGGAVIEEKTIIFTPGQRQVVSFGTTTITLPSNCFAVATTVKLQKTPAPTLTQAKFQPLQPQLTVRATSDQTAPLTLSYPNPANGQPTIATLLEGNQSIGVLPVKTQDQQLVVSISPADLNAQKSRGTSPVINVVIGSLTHYAPPDTKTGLQAIGQAKPGRTLVFVHGLLQNAQTNADLLATLGQQGGYSSVYSFAYDWRLAIDQAGQGLAQALQPFPAKQVDIIAYSKGGLVTRWALEKLGATKPVSRVMFLGVPNFGCTGTLASLYSLFGSWFLNNSSDLQAVYDPNDNCLAELLPSSSRLGSLNGRGYGQNGKVGYFFAAGNYLTTNSDGVVGLKSALCQESSAVNDLTNGPIQRWTIENKSHLQLDEAAPLAFERWLSSWPNIVKLTVSPNPTEASSGDGSWSFSVEIRNPTSETLQLESLEFEEFDAFGQWVSNNWYKPGLGSDEFLPNSRWEWNEELRAGETRTLQLRAWSDYQKTAVWNAEPARQAFMVHLILEARTSGNQHFESEVLECLTYNGRSPVPPNTRQSHDQRRSQPVGLSVRP